LSRPGLYTNPRGSKGYGEAHTKAIAGNITTPLLLIHSDGDLRCPAGQAEEMFAALRLQRKVVEYLRYPAESSHGLSRNGPPDLRLARLRRNLDWLNRWLKS
jgi:dipeptidyl aminopeptidase/acylaminoacyl peptidase